MRKFFLRAPSRSSLLQFRGSDDEKRSKIACGVFVDKDDDEYTDIYDKLMEKAEMEKKSEEPL